MHDCRKLENGLVDLVFNELPPDEKRKLLTEIEKCTACLSEYHSMTETLLVFDQSVEASLPDESYWPEHHAALCQRLETHAAPVKTKRDSFWKRLLRAKLPIPVPVAAVVAIVLLSSSILALRHPKVEVMTAQPVTLATTTTPPRIIEVPVIHERVVTRTVYVEKRGRVNNGGSRQTPTQAPYEPSLTARYLGNESGQGNLFTRINLTDFQPPDEMKIRIIKRRNSDEN